MLMLQYIISNRQKPNLRIYEQYKKIAEDISLKKELKKAKREYSEYIGKWFIDGEGCVFKITNVNVSNIYHNEEFDRYGYAFLVFSPNNPNFDAIIINELQGNDEDGNKYTEITEKEAKKRCGFRAYPINRTHIPYP